MTRRTTSVVAGWGCTEGATPLSLFTRASTLPGVSSLWTPEGEHRVGPATGTGTAAGPPERRARTRRPATRPAGTGDASRRARPRPEPRGAGRDWPPSSTSCGASCVATPAEVVVANHAYGLFELAAIHLSQQPPDLDQARLAVDALAAVVGGLAGRLGEAEPLAPRRPGPDPADLRPDQRDGWRQLTDGDGLEPVSRPGAERPESSVSRRPRCHGRGSHGPASRRPRCPGPRRTTTGCTDVDVTAARRRSACSGRVAAPVVGRRTTRDPGARRTR